jgi:hypothetical protein
VRTISIKIVLIFLPFLFLSCYEKECNCDNYKTGKFEFVQKIDGEIHTTIFERTSTMQIETYNNKVDTASLRWINNCEFILKKINPKNRQEKRAIAMKILSTNSKGYYFEYYFVGEQKKQYGTVTKIN